jgi:hypothetical protein
MEKLNFINKATIQVNHKYSKYLLPLTVSTILLLANTAEAAEIPIINSMATSAKETLTGSVKNTGEALAIVGSLFHYVITKNPWFFGSTLGIVGGVELVLPLIK